MVEERERGGGVGGEAGSGGAGEEEGVGVVVEVGEVHGGRHFGERERERSGGRRLKSVRIRFQGAGKKIGRAHV